ncbi:MAG: transglutaminase domain-containing protein [Oscillospiraceae bacterium]|nr:transglutaminase domain-containing protein [Oscillospiraceae bacterium]
MKLLNLKNGGLLIDAFCAFGISCAILCVILPFTFPVRSYKDVIILTAIAMIIVLIFSRKWWLLPSTIAVLTPIGLLIVSLLDPDRRFLAALRFFDPFSVVLAEGASYPDFDVFLLRVAVILTISSLAFLYYRRLFFFTPVPVLLLGILIYLFYQDPRISMGILPLVLIVLFVSFAKAQGKRSARIDPELGKDTVFFHIISAAVILVVVVPLSVWTTPKEDGNWKSKSLGNFVEDVSDVIHFHGKANMPGGLFDLSFSGFTPLNQRLGGNIITNNIPTMYVTTQTPIPMGGAYYDTYNGEMWYDTATLSKYRFNSLLTASLRKEVFQDDLPKGSGDIRRMTGKMQTHVVLSVRSVIYGRSLFASGKITSFSASYSLDDSSAFFNEQGEMFIAGEPMSAMWYEIEADFFDRSKPDFDQNMFVLESLVQDSQDSFYEDKAEIYRQLPDTLPQTVFDMEHEITAGIDSPYLKALAIESWLAENCTYTLSPGNPPEGKDFVEHFLDTRKGYCTYYASAMTVLARCAGLPARYVSGFVLQRSPYIKSTGYFVASNATAHAWTEVYFKGIGWVQFDPLSPNPYTIGDTFVPETTPGNQATITQMPSGRPSDYDDFAETNPDQSVSNAEILLAVTIILLLILLVYLSIRAVLLFMPAKALHKWISAKNIDISTSADFCYRRILRQFAYLGYTIMPGETASAFSKRIHPIWFEESTRNIFDIVILLRFALKEPSPDDLKVMCLYSTQLERKLVRSRGFLRYLIRRLLFGSI